MFAGTNILTRRLRIERYMRSFFRKKYISYNRRNPKLYLEVIIMKFEEIKEKIGDKKRKAIEDYDVEAVVPEYIVKEILEKHKITPESITNF